MGKKNKKITARKPSHTGKIKAQQPTQTDHVKFSFKHCELTHSKFTLDDCDATYWPKMLERLKGLCAMKMLDLQTNRSSALRFHPINWEDTTEPNGFSHLNEVLQGCTPYQLSISSNKYGRIHGFTIDDVFYVVWIDPNHLLYA